MLLLHKHLLFSQAPTFKDRLSAPFGANGWIVYQSARTRARGKVNFFQKSVLASQKDDNSVKNCNIFWCRSQESGGRSLSWSSELESGREFLATKNRRSRRGQESGAGVGERSWRWSGSPSEGIRRIRRGLPEEELPDADNERNCGGGAKLAARVGCVFGI